MNLLFSFLIITVVLVMITGLYSLITTKNLVRMIISLELLTKSVVLLIIVTGYIVKRPGLAQSMVITMIVIEVATVAVAAGIAVGLFRRYGTLNIEHIRSFKSKEE